MRFYTGFGEPPLSFPDMEDANLRRILSPAIILRAKEILTVVTDSNQRMFRGPKKGTAHLHLFNDESLPLVQTASDVVIN